MTTLFLTYQPPYDWQWMTAFLGARALQGVEQQDGEYYQRTLAVMHNGERLTGWLRLRPLPERNGVELEVSSSLSPVAENVAAQVRRLLDLDAQPQVIADGLGALAENAPGLRLPGCADRFELVVRAILGQLVSVKMAATLATRLTEKWGEPVRTPFAVLTHLFPSPAAIGQLTVDDLRSIGVQAKRAACLINIAQAVEEGRLPLNDINDVQNGIKQLLAMPGIGNWTASYVAMRAWSAPDIFLGGDYLIKQRFPGMTPGKITRYAEVWKPWRTYATLHLWFNNDWQPDTP
ncbi:Ada family regulatory protein [Rahnella aquatilis CIP 78.65 = ATCC 33071]|uniref:DNA-3-methyladenine glycosylase II n=1 Tax=Rahnella aquatilis (strain ATCC 33071 / DSM 4594 / JCM 1683 / NBRC 105701 / NCIMB 13365 / CIP 78.65) TaxID=745277 RepID=H2IYU8_RAHAC|nr:DNA-3-methyladenine glycosylase 2 [Rahnella aquatilis]AEX53163.1 3-methyladenine DNA glycosylase/8-oxoguanine DNA glycosylase [Rahnella aquatilis CIP 78.65 = ATCC 33071]KFD04042.1 Ada family regulatory protein [Rahnella aquatilis CIP 78.65 = ATCC 33071]